MNEIFKIIRLDVQANQGNLEVILFLGIFRITSFLKQSIKKEKFGLVLIPIYILFRLFYKFLSTVYLMEIPVGTRIGGGLTIYHLKGTVINGDAIIGSNVTINHFITISDNIKIADGAVINPLSVLVKGDIGKNAIIGAGSVVTKDVEDNMIVAGSPAKVIGNVT